MVDSETCSDYVPAVETRRRPCDADAGIKVSVVRIVQGGVPRTRRRVNRCRKRAVRRSGAQTNSVKFSQIEHRGSVVGFMRHPVILPAQSCVKRKRGRDLPLILEIRKVKGTAKLVTAPGRVEGQPVKRSGHEPRIHCAAAVLKRESIVGGL